MRIIIREKSSKDIRLCLPTGLLLNDLSATILCLILKRKQLNITGSQLRRLFRGINRYKSQRSEWKLIEIMDASGDYVEILV